MAKPRQVGPASWPVGNVEQAFQPATPTFLSALRAASYNPPFGCGPAALRGSQSWLPPASAGVWRRARILAESEERLKAAAARIGHSTAPRHFKGAALSRPADKSAAADQEAERKVGRLRDADTRSGFDFESDGPERLADDEAAAGDIGGVVSARDGERQGDFGGARREVLEFARGRPASAHEVQPRDRFEGANQDASSSAGRFADQVEALIHPVNEVNVGVAGRPEDDLGARGDAACRVGGLVVCAEVGFGFDNDAGGAAVDEDLTEQGASDIDGRAGVKGARQDGTEGHSSLLYNGG